MESEIENQEKDYNQTQQELIMSDEFDKALTSGAEIQNNDISLCKSRNKNNFSHFYDVLVASNREIRSILDMKKKDRSTEDEEKLKEFKKNASKCYKQICTILMENSPVDTTSEIEDEDNGEQETTVEKIVHKITDVVKYLSYIGDTSIDDEFKKFGIELKYEPLTENEMFAQDHIKEEITAVFNTGKEIKMDMESGKNKIKNNIYSEAVPLELQYDKNENPTGIKKSDFTKLVDIKAKLMSAKDNDDEQEKTKEKAEKLATEYVFQNRRNEILNRKVTEFACTVIHK